MTSLFVVVYVAPSCGPPTPVYCDVIGCVHVTAVCMGLVTCPNVILANLCSQNGNLLFTYVYLSYFADLYAAIMLQLFIYMHYIRCN